MNEHEAEDYEAYTGIGRPPLELLLLALIDGHAYEGEKNRGQRLNQAMLAIAGVKAAPGPLPNDPYERGCLIMAQAEHQDGAASFDYQWLKRQGKDVPAVPPRKRSVLELAKLAEQQVFGSQNSQTEHANIQRLRETYTGTYQKKLKGRDGVDHRATYRYQVTEQDLVVESLDRQSLKTIAHELKTMGVPFKL